MIKDTSLAIVIPYFKISYFEETLISLTNQTNKNFHLYIGNDASPEDPMDLINLYQRGLDLTYKHFKDNLGAISLTKQWDRCIEMTKEEEWIMILGDDDVLDVNVVENFFLHHSEFKGKANVIRLASQVIDAKGTHQSPVFKNPKWEKAPDSFFRWLNGKTRSSLSEHLFTKKAYNKYKFKNYPLGWHSDDIAWLDFPDGKKIYSINNSTVYIRHSGLNITSAIDNLELKEEASLRFRNDLIFEKLIIFTKHQKKKLLLNFEILNKKKNNMNLKNWNSLFIFYIQHCSLIENLKLLRRFFLYQLKQVSKQSSTADN